MASASATSGKGYGRSELSQLQAIAAANTALLTSLLGAMRVSNMDAIVGLAIDGAEASLTATMLGAPEDGTAVAEGALRRLEEIRKVALPPDGDPR